MSTVTIDNTAYSLPADEFTATKVTSYNTLLTAIQAAWTTYSPTWTNLSVGNGTVTARYRQIGTLVETRITIVFGSTTSISGAVSVSLPVTRATYAGTAGLTALGLARFFDTSGGAASEGAAMNVSTTTVRLQVWKSDGTYLTSADLSSTVPFTWATGDEINVQFSYEAA